MDHDEKIRVLIADDSYFVRRYLHELLTQDPDILVIGEAKDGAEAVVMATELHPDVITMDYRMPRKNGLEATAEIMLGSHPLPAVVILSAFAGTDGRETLARLRAAGALVIEKPSGEVSLDIDRIAGSIISTVKKVGDVQRRIRMYARALVDRAGRNVHVRERFPAPLALVVVGASTGGPPLVEHILSSLGGGSDAAIVIVQHMSKYFTELFADRLDRISPTPVHEARDGEELVPGSIVVAPGNSAVVFERVPNFPARVMVRLAPIPEKHDERFIDTTMISAADVFGAASVGILLSGMGNDGTEGLRAIHRKGGITYVQEPSSATVASMPESAIASGAVDQVLSLEEIPDALLGAIRNIVTEEEPEKM